MKKLLPLLLAVIVISGCGNTNNMLQDRATQSPPTNSISNEPVTPVVNNVPAYLTRGTNKQFGIIKETAKTGQNDTLVSANESGDTTTLLASITATAQNISPKTVKTTDYFVVNEVTADDNYIILTQANGSDGFNMPIPLWRFNVQTKKLTPLSNINKLINTNFTLIFSPDRRRVAAANWDTINNTNACLGDSRTLYLLDLINDSIRAVVSLKAGETLAAGYCGVSPAQKIVWLDDKRIQYDVYDQTKASQKNNNEGIYKPLLETRIYTINNKP